MLDEMVSEIQRLKIVFCPQCGEALSRNGKHQNQEIASVTVTCEYTIAVIKQEQVLCEGIRMFYFLHILVSMRSLNYCHRSLKRTES